MCINLQYSLHDCSSMLTGYHADIKSADGGISCRVCEGHGHLRDPDGKRLPTHMRVSFGDGSRGICGGDFIPCHSLGESAQFCDGRHSGGAVRDRGGHGVN